VGSQHDPGRVQRTGRQGELLGHHLEDPRTAGMDSPVPHVVRHQPVAAEELIHQGTDVAGQDVGHPPRQAHAKPEVGDVPGHVIGGGGIGPGRHVHHGQTGAEARPGVTHGIGGAADTRSSAPDVCCGDRPRFDHQGRRPVGEQRMGHHLLEPARGRLDMQAGQLQAQQQGRTAAGHDVVAERPEAGDRCVASHVPDEQTLGPGAHPELVGQADVDAGRGVPGAGDHGEEPDICCGQAGGRQGTRRRSPAERHGLLHVADHPGAGRPPGDVLPGGVDRHVAGGAPGGEEHPSGPLVVPRVRAVELVPQVLLGARRRKGAGRPGDHCGVGRGPRRHPAGERADQLVCRPRHQKPIPTARWSPHEPVPITDPVRGSVRNLVPQAWNSTAVERVGTMGTRSRRPAQ
jgi:hypothetical protein